MAKYRVGRLELHEYPVEIEAKNPLEAIERVLKGQGTPLDIEEGTFIEIDEEHGMAINELVRENPELNTPENLKKIQKVLAGKTFIPSICSIEEVEDDE